MKHYKYVYALINVPRGKYCLLPESKQYCCQHLGVGDGGVWMCNIDNEYLDFDEAGKVEKSNVCKNRTDY